MMLEHLGESDASARLMQAIEQITADERFHTPDLGGRARTAEVTTALIAAIRG
jgi:tartrate dehydrogenase/decarboxylase/D-malate dehydrogenase